MIVFNTALMVSIPNFYVAQAKDCGYLFMLFLVTRT